MNARGRRLQGYQRERGPRLRETPNPSVQAPPLGALVRRLHKQNLSKDARRHIKTAVISDCRLVTSYNWLDIEEWSILVPGRPPRWTPPKETRRLEEDSGNYFRDQNAARFPKHPLEPAVVASLSAEPTLPSAVDIVACSSTLGNLCRLVRGENKEFRISAELIDGTVFLVRRENSPTELIMGVRGHGHSFPEAYTTWDADVKGSSSHQRIIRYNFGGLGLLVRFGSDGYLGNNGGKVPPSSAAKATAADAETSVDQLASMFIKNSMSSASPNAITKLKVARGGSLVDQALVFDLKTRGAWKKNQDIIGEELPRLWVAQIPKFILAFHNKGVFDDVEVRDVVADVAKWEQTHVDDLAHLAALLHYILEVLSARPDGRLELHHAGYGVLAMHEQLPDVHEALSPEVKMLWKKGARAEEDHITASLDEDADSDEGVKTRSGAEHQHDDIADDLEWNVESSPDYTACSADSCGYCGKCSY